MAKTFLEMLAEVPQIEKRTFWPLRKFRKSKRECFGVCGTPANQKENALAFAGLPQIKKRTLWRLRDSRKSKKERFGACGSSANRKKSVLAFAELPQATKSTFRHLRNFRKPFPKTLCSLQPSIQAILQGLGILILSFKLTLQRFQEGEIRCRGHPFRPRSTV